MTAAFRYSKHVRCHCTGPDGKLLGQACPKLWRPGGKKVWVGGRHGSGGWAARIPTSKGTRLIKRFGFTTTAAIDESARHAGQLLELAGADPLARAKIGDLITATRRGQPLPSVEDVRRRLGLGLDPGQPGMTAGEWMESWLAGKSRTRKASTVRSYEYHIRVYIAPVIGDVPLERVSTSHVEAVLAGVAGSAATRHRVLATLRAALNTAMKRRLITWNPANGIELEPENPPEAKRWTPAEAARFIAHVSDDPLGLAYRVMVLRGLRRAELTGLRWSGADLDRGVLTVKRTIVQLGGRLVEEATAKSRAGDRLVFLDAETARLLREHRKAQLAARLAAGEAWQDNDLIFCKPDGRPWLPDHVSKKFKRLAAKAGVPVITLHHGGRHTGNSLMRDAGVDQELRMREVGHAGREINDRYTHTLIEAHLAAAEQTAALVREAGGES
jgi:integrase